MCRHLKIMISVKSSQVNLKLVIHQIKARSRDESQTRVFY